MPARGSINVHGSLLPRYRGAAPIAWAIIRGETETGITTFQMDAGMDTGDVLLTRGDADRPRGDGRRAVRAAGASRRAAAAANARAARHAHARCRRITRRPRWRRDSRRRTAGCDSREPARDLVDRVRGCNPWPGAALRRRPAGSWSGARPRCRARRRRGARHARRDSRAPSPSPPATACSSRSRSSRRTARRWRGTTSCAAPACRPGARVTELAREPGSQGGPGRPGPVRGAAHPGARRAGPRLRRPRARGRARSRARSTLRDAALCTEIVYGTLRWQRHLDWRLAPHCNRPLATLDPWVRALLRLTAYQLVFLDRVPRWAAVDEAVSIARLKSRNAGPRGVRQRGAAGLHAGRPARPPTARRSGRGGRRSAGRFRTGSAARWIARYGLPEAETPHGGR